MRPETDGLLREKARCRTRIHCRRDSNQGPLVVVDENTKQYSDTVVSDRVPA